MSFSLRKKISVFFVVIALVSSLAVTAITIYNTNRLFADYVGLRLEIKQEQWQGLLTSYYLENGTWEGVEKILSPVSGMRSGGMGPGVGRRFHGRGLQGMGRWGDTVVLADSSYRVIAATHSFSPGSIIPPELRKRGEKLQVEGKNIGYLFINPSEQNGLSELERQYTASVLRTSLGVGALIALIAALIGVFFGRRLTKPLQKLTAATKRIAQGDRRSRVTVRGDNEIGELALSFNVMAESLEKADKARRNLVADVAHELRNPLAIMRGQLESILEGRIEAKPEVILSLNDEVLRLSRMVGDLQELSLAEAGQLKLTREQFFMKELFEKYREILTPQLEEKEIKFCIAEDGGVPQVNADRNRIQQVILNLLANALRHVPHGGTIRVTISEKNGQVTTKVFNSGSKIAEEEIPYLFERFYKGDKSRTRKQSGTGLGLAIAKGFVEAHGGTIGVKNGEDGVSFYFTLPIFKN